MRCRPFVAGIGHIDLAWLGWTPRDGAEATMDCRYTALGTASAGNTNYRARASDSSQLDSRQSQASAACSRIRHEACTCFRPLPGPRYLPVLGSIIEM